MNPSPEKKPPSFPPRRRPKYTHSSWASGRLLQPRAGAVLRLVGLAASSPRCSITPARHAPAQDYPVSSPGRTGGRAERKSPSPPPCWRRPTVSPHLVEEAVVLVRDRI